MSTLFMETTKIAPERTVAEIQSKLAQYGAKAILLEYEGKEVQSVSFQYTVGPQVIPFQLPCRWQNMAQLLRKRANITDFSWTQAYYKSRRADIEDKARRVAWRQILRWVEAQLALVDTDMVKLQEVFFPYIMTNQGKTVYELQDANHFQLLGSGQR